MHNKESNALAGRRTLEAAFAGALTYLPRTLARTAGCSSGFAFALAFTFTGTFAAAPPPLPRAARLAAAKSLAETTAATDTAGGARDTRCFLAGGSDCAPGGGGGDGTGAVSGLREYIAFG